ncbi:MAG: hypothetical protein GY810_30830 [Aureispira sp.]|nr:hypothetical protein [Aureispira sp.]
MKKYDVTILTDARYVNPTEIDDYTQNVLDEDRLVAEALEAKGLRVARVDWADPDFDWTSTRTALFRTTWDYFYRFEEFSVWLEQVSQKTQLINSPELLRWSMDKHYLKELLHKGINIPATLFLEHETLTTLEQLHVETAWEQSVLKPAISGAARHTYRLNMDNLDAHETIFTELIEQEDMLLQEFQHNVVSKGEVAYMLFGGKFSHAILKKAKAGDFRVQDDFGGTVHQYTPTTEEIAFAEKAVAACPTMPIYARVDVIWDNNDQLAVSELELIEPELWFRFEPKAAELLANAIVAELEPKAKAY